MLSKNAKNPTPSKKPLTQGRIDDYVGLKENPSAGVEFAELILFVIGLG